MQTPIHRRTIVKGSAWAAPAVAVLAATPATAASGEPLACPPCLVLNEHDVEANVSTGYLYLPNAVVTGGVGHYVGEVYTTMSTVYCGFYVQNNILWTPEIEGAAFGVTWTSGYAIFGGSEGGPDTVPFQATSFSGPTTGIIGTDNIVLKFPAIMDVNVPNSPWYCPAGGPWEANWYQPYEVHFFFTLTMTKAGQTSTCNLEAVMVNMPGSHHPNSVTVCAGESSFPDGLGWTAVKNISGNNFIQCAGCTPWT